MKTQSLPIDIHELRRSFQIDVSVPGVLSNNVRLDFDRLKNELRIKVKTSPVNYMDRNEKKAILTERISGTLERCVSFPFCVRVNPHKITASLIDGILTILIPKAEVFESNKLQYVK